MATTNLIPKRLFLLLISLIILFNAESQTEPKKNIKATWLLDSIIEYNVIRVPNYKIGTIPTYDNQVVTNISQKNGKKFKRMKRSIKKQLLFDSNRGWAAYILLLSVYHINIEEGDVLSKSDFYEKTKNYTEENIEEFIKW